MGKNSSKFENQNNENINQNGGDNHLNPLIRPKAIFKDGILTNEGILQNLIRQKLGFRTTTWAEDSRILLIKERLPVDYNRLVNAGIIIPTLQPKRVVLSSPRQKPRFVVSPPPRGVVLSSPQPRGVVLSSPQPKLLVSPRSRALSPQPKRDLSRQPPAVVLSSTPLQSRRVVPSLRPQPRRIQQRVVSTKTQLKKCNKCGQIQNANRLSCVNCGAIFIN